MDTPHWYRRVLPVTALAVGLVALLAVLVPGVRDQVRLSATHQQQEYVALSFSRSHAGTVPVCGGGRGEVTVAFTVEGELRSEHTLRYVVTAGEERRTGSVPVGEGDTVDVTESFPRPDRGFDVSVALPGADREIHAHCRGATR